MQAEATETPFVQGYIKAMLAGTDAAASDIAGESLAVIEADCAAFQADRSFTSPAHYGANFWRDRQIGFPQWPYHGELYRNRFPPVAISRGDDGRVHLGSKA